MPLTNFALYLSKSSPSQLNAASKRTERVDADREGALSRLCAKIVEFCVGDIETLQYNIHDVGTSYMYMCCVCVEEFQQPIQSSNLYDLRPTRRACLTYESLDDAFDAEPDPIQTAFSLTYLQRGTTSIEIRCLRVSLHRN